eukprot:1148923-Pelagomonas_calceolata.AAC.6
MQKGRNALQRFRGVAMAGVQDVICQDGYGTHHLQGLVLQVMCRHECEHAHMPVCMCVCVYWQLRTSVGTPPLQALATSQMKHPDSEGQNAPPIACFLVPEMQQKSTSTKEHECSV